MKQRQANYELLRIVAMMMVVSLHFLGKGGLLPDMAQDYGIQGGVAWLIEAFCAVAVDIYVLISGYFLVESDFRLRKLLLLWGQVIFYSLGIPAVCLAIGILPWEALSLDRILTWVFPVLREHYWFATAYVLLYVFSPLLGKGIKQIEKKQFQIILGILLGIFCFSSSLLPFDIALDKGGYDVAWFLCLYLTAAYLRIYGIPKVLGGKNGLALYFCSTCGMWGLSRIYRIIYFKTGKLDDFISSPFRYNHVLCLLAAIALFGCFSRIVIQSDKAAKCICTAASGTFGVYLLHEHEILRTVWPFWMGSGKITGAGSLVLHLLLAAAVVMAAGIVLDLLRNRLFMLLKIR